MLIAWDALEENISALAGKVYYYRNENYELRKRIALLEKENTQLRDKRNFTVARLKELMRKFEEAGIE
ncbi:hypothetical protein AMJ80_07225 [bacterium SM23_31]|nr:MAG: hypothetical protein AMJ80_07225 [bacterium SM23_31]